MYILTKPPRLETTFSYVIYRCFACNTQVVVGTNRLDQGGTSYTSGSIVIHEKYNNVLLKPKPYDIALVIVNKDIVFGDKVKAISMSSSNIAGGVDVLLTGWGKTQV